MDKATKTKIKNMVLTLRGRFEEEIENRLNYHGIYIDKTWKDGRSLRHLSPKESSNKKRVEAFIKRQESTGSSLSQDQATKEFIKEASYTWINRLIGLKCMEARGLIDEEVITVRDTFGGRSERHRNFIEENPELAHTSDEELTACLMDVFRKVTEEIKILFDPDNEYSLIVPRYRCLKDAIDLINNSVDYDIYREDELLGWLYQYFQTKEKDRIFDEVYKKKKKISGSDIIPVTSLYTEKYMVRFLVENSLGAIWMEMYPDSELYKNWEYFVKDPNNTTRESKPIQEITFLDPACGSGHFLLYAFDLFYQMYKEEGVVPEEEIPAYILRYNIHGIDIDLRSVQLSALGLWMKAKSKNRDIKIEQMNLVAANAVMVDGDRIAEFLEEFGTDEPAKELVRTIWRGLQNIRELGSLLKVEEQTDEVIERVKSQTRISGEWEKERFTWGRWKQRIMDKLKEYTDKAMQFSDINKEMFASETIKGLNFIDLISQKYDVVATNPPYMGNKTMDKKLGDYLKSIYSKNSFDLYASFIDRNISFSEIKGKVAMITQQTFMFNEYFECLRDLLLSKCCIRKVIHLGPGAFKDIMGAKVNTAMFILERGQPQGKSTFIRVLSYENKERAIRETLNDPNTSKNLFEIDQNAFKCVELKPFVYNFSDNILDLYKRAQYLKSYIDIVYGVITRNNDKYIRFCWEIPDSNERWIHCEKQASGTKYFDGTIFKLDFSHSALTNYGSHIPKEEDWFKEGIVFGTVGTYFGAKYLPLDHMIEHAVHLIAPKKHDELMPILGFLNSKLAKHILNSINPTCNFGVNDINRIPFSNNMLSITVSVHTQYCVSIKKSLLQFVINDREFEHTAIQYGRSINPNETNLEDLYKIYLNHAEEEYVKLHTYEAMIDKEIFDLYEIDGEDLEQILREQGIPASYFPVIEGYELIPEDMLPEAKEYIKNLERKDLSGDELNKLGLRLKELYEKGKSIEDISVALKINPVSVAAMRKELGLINAKDLKHEVENLLTYLILGQLKKDKDGIIPISETTHEEPLIKRLINDFEKIFGDENVDAVLTEMKSILGRDLESWLSKEFFKKHISQYKKRPIIWQVKSKGGNFDCLLYYHKLDSQALLRLKHQYLSKALEINNSKLVEQREKVLVDKNTQIYQMIERLESVGEDIRDLDRKLDAILGKGYDPVIDDGVMVNVALLQDAGVLGSDVLSKSQINKAFTLGEEMRRERAGGG